MNKPKSQELPSFRSDLSRRLRVLEQQFKNRAEAAKAAGVAKGTYQTWVDGRSVPSIEAMAHLAKATSTSLDWLAFGAGDQDVAERTGWYRYDPPYNYDWMWQILDLLKDLYILSGHNDLPDSLLYDAADIYEEAAKIQDPDERSRAISMAVALYTKRIKPPEPAEQTPTTKRRA